MPTDIKQFFVFPTRAIDNTVPINIVVMATFNKIDKPDVRNQTPEGNTKISFSIVFQEGLAANEGQSLEWRYKEEVCRDQDYEELKAKVSTNLGA